MKHGDVTIVHETSEDTVSKLQYPHAVQYTKP